MDIDFWHERWRQGQIGFHADEPNALLTAYWQKMTPEAGSRVLVPLCGKSLDMVWLRAQGHKVRGVELSPLAVTAIFDEQGLVPQRRSIDGFSISYDDDLEVYCGDFFGLTKAHVADVSTAFDRAALVALPPEMQARYACHLMEILPPAACVLLITLEYDAAEMSGPPFSVATGQVQALFGSRFAISLLHDRDAFAQGDPLIARGLSWLRERAYRLYPLNA